MADVQERFWAKVDIGGDDDCWNWNACLVSGYGAFGVERGKRVKSHRFSYESLVGPIPDGLVLDHLCRNTSCVNPAHLEPVSVRENTMRGSGPTSENAKKTHCNQGHEYTEENTYRPPSGQRVCRTCRIHWKRRWNETRREVTPQ